MVYVLFGNVYKVIDRKSISVYDVGEGVAEPVQDVVGEASSAEAALASLLPSELSFASFPCPPEADVFIDMGVTGASGVTGEAGGAAPAEPSSGVVSFVVG